MSHWPDIFFEKKKLFVSYETPFTIEKNICLVEVVLKTF